MSLIANLKFSAGAVQLLMLGRSSVPIVQCRHVWGNVIRPNPRGKNRPNKHLNEWTGRLRAAKILKIELPDFDRQRKMQSNSMTPEERRAEMKRAGIQPATPTSENPIYMGSLSAVIDSFVPPEGDGKASLLSKEGAKEKMTLVTSKGKSLRASRKIKQFDEDYTNASFVQTAQKIYIDTHEALSRKDETSLHKLVTEKFFPEMMVNVQRKSIHWEFLKSLEPPRIVQVRVVDVINKNNNFAQITVRFHNQQVLAIYDRFGRLIIGNPVVAKDVLEYVVFEKYLSSVYGTWRMHAKIIPDWLAKDRSPSVLTQILPKIDTYEDQVEDDGKASDESEKDDEDDSAIYDKFGRKIKS